MKMNVKEKQEKGITLIALIITIIVLVILAAVTIFYFSQSKIINVAINGTTSYANSMKQEEDIFNELSGKVEHALDQLNSGLSAEQLRANIGKYVKYTPDSNTFTTNIAYTGTTSAKTFETRDFNWRIWDVSNGNITLIADGLTVSTLTLNGAQGYNNAVSIINELCEKCYSNSEMGGVGRSINIKDIENILTIEPDKINPVVIDGTLLYAYKGSKEWSGASAAYPYIHSLEEYSNIDGSEKGIGSGITRSTIQKSGSNYVYYKANENGATNGIKTASTIKPTRTAWTRTASTTDFKDAIYYDIIFRNATTNSSFVQYYLASRSLDMNADWNLPLYGMQSIGSSSIKSDYLYAPTKGDNSLNYAVRPMVTIPLSNVKIGMSGNGSIESKFEMLKR